MLAAIAPRRKTPPAVLFASQLLDSIDQRLLLVNAITKMAATVEEAITASNILSKTVSAMGKIRRKVDAIRPWVVGRSHLKDRLEAASEFIKDLAQKIMTVSIRYKELELLGPGEWRFSLSFPQRPPEGDPFQFHRRSRLFFSEASRSLVEAWKKAAAARWIMEAKPGPEEAKSAGELLFEATQDLEEAHENMSILASRGFLPSKKILKMWRDTRFTIATLAPRAMLASRR